MRKEVSLPRSVGDLAQFPTIRPDGEEVDITRLHHQKNVIRSPGRENLGKSIGARCSSNRDPLPVTASRSISAYAVLAFV